MSFQVKAFLKPIILIHSLNKRLPWQADFIFNSSVIYDLLDVKVVQRHVWQAHTTLVHEQTHSLFSADTKNVVKWNEMVRIKKAFFTHLPPVFVGVVNDLHTITRTGKECHKEMEEWKDKKVRRKQEYSV